MSLEIPGQCIGGVGAAKLTQSIAFAGRRADTLTAGRNNILPTLNNDDRPSKILALQCAIYLEEETKRLVDAASPFASLRDIITPAHVLKECLPAFGIECSSGTTHLKSSYKVKLPSGATSSLHLDAYHHTLHGRGAHENGEAVARISASFLGTKLRLESTYLFCGGEQSSYEGRTSSSGVRAFVAAFAEALGVAVDPADLLEVLGPQEVLSQITPDPEFEETGKRNEPSTVRADLLRVVATGKDLASWWKVDG